MKVRTYSPEDRAREVYLRLPEKRRKGFLTSWHFLQATPFWNGLAVEYIEDWQALSVSAFIPPEAFSPSKWPFSLTKDPYLASSYLATVYDHLLTFTRNLARVQWPGHRIHVEAAINFSIWPVLFPGSVEVRLLAEPASRARARRTVQRRMYQACVQFYLEKGRAAELVEKCGTIEVGSYISESSMKAMEQVPKFAEFKKYLMEQGYIDETYRPLKKMTSIEQAIDRWFKVPSYCPICGAVIEKKRKNKTTCGHKNCRKKKQRVKDYLRKLLGREALSREQIINKFQEHQEYEKIRKRYKEYREIKDVPLLVDLILSELPPPVEEL